VLLAAVVACALALTFATTSHAGAIETLAGCTTNSLAANDDGSTGTVPLPFTANFFGNTYTSLYVNNNGNVTFDFAMSTYTPFPLLTTTHPMIAPYFGDVDTRNPASDIVRYGDTTYGGHPALCVNWDGVGVGYYNYAADKLNKFQLLLVDRSDVGAGDFDIYFNYDQVQWESGSASGGSGGLGGASARVGWSNGTSTSFELPGSAVNGAFLDSNPATGLIYNSRDSLVLGRYVFPVRNGSAPVGGTIRGHIWANSAGNPLGAAFVQLCSPVFCQTTQSSSTGNYAFTGLADGAYTLTVFPPSGSSLSSGGLAGLFISGSNTLDPEDVVLTGPTPPPPGTAIGPSSGSGVPVVYWNNDLTLTTEGCVGGTGTWQVTGVGWSTSGSMTETPAGSGHYVGTIPAFYPNHGNAHVSITLSCGTTVGFDIYIDPSGTVRDTTGHAIAGATVTLYRADDSGTFVVVPDGSAIMSPANRLNPDTTDVAGHFGWDVIAGQYKVRASAPDCHAPGDASQAYVETDVLTIPPPVTDLVLTLECTRRDTTPPVITVPDPISAEATGPEGAIVSYTASATDDTDGTVAVTCSPGSGSVFPLGTTTVTCDATDSSANGASASFTVTVVDTTPPSITCPAPIVAEATAPGGANVTPAAASATDLAGAVTVTNPPAAFFPLGTTTITYSATDEAGLTASCTSEITVVDTTPPDLTVPADIVVDATSPAGAAVSFTVTAADLAGAATVNCLPASGGTFAIGTTTVSCTATDTSGNTSTKTFHVRVLGAGAQLTELIADSTGVGPGTSLADKARQAKAYLAAGDDANACAALNAYLKELKAQTGKKVSAAKAAALAAEVRQIRAVIGC